MPSPSAGSGGCPRRSEWSWTGRQFPQVDGLLTTGASARIRAVRRNAGTLQVSAFRRRGRVPAGCCLHRSESCSLPEHFRRPAAWAERPRAFPGRSAPQASGLPEVNRTAAIYWLRPAPIARLARPLSGRRIRPSIEWRTRTGPDSFSSPAQLNIANKHRSSQRPSQDTVARAGSRRT